MRPPDRDIVRRDRALPGLGVVLEPERFLEALRGAWPDRELSDPQLTYLRYKPETNCLAAYAVCVDGARTFVHATAHRLGDEAKLRKVLKFTGESPLAPQILPCNIALRAFPTDRKLGALGRLFERAARRRLLAAALPEHPELWDAEIEVLRYKPERRLVARLRAPDGPRALLKLYHDGDFQQAWAGAEGFSRSALHTAPLLGAEPRQHLMVWRWLDGTPGDALSSGAPDFAAEVGQALSTLHAQPPAGLLPVARAEESAPLRAAAASVAYLLPELSARVHALAAALAARLGNAPPLAVPVHGDFSLDQLIATPAGVAIIDFDAAALGDPAWDFGTFGAQLEHAALRGELSAARVSAIREALEAGYAAQGGSVPPRTALYTAAGLLRLAPHAFRTRRADWPEETQALVARAEALL